MLDPNAGGLFMRQVVVALVSLILGLSARGAEGDQPLREAPRILKAADAGVGRALPDVSLTDLEGKAFKLSQFSDRKAIVVAVWTPNCPISKKYAPRLVDKGKLTTAPKDSLAAPGADRRGAQREAQNAFEARLEQNPLPYAEQLAESAARRGFGPRSVKLQGRDKQLAGVPIPGLPPGQKEFFGAAKSRALAEDVHLIKRMKDSGISSRKELRQTVADALRAGAESGDVVATDSGRMIYYSRASDWAVVIDPADGLVVSGFPLKLAGQTWEADYKAKYK